MFQAVFDKVRAVEDRTVNLEGRIPRMSEYKGCRVAVVVLEDDPSNIGGTIVCDDGMMQQELVGMDDDMNGT